MANLPDLRFCSLAFRDFRDGVPIQFPWGGGPLAPTLGKDDIHVWLANCGDVKPNGLSSDEEMRAAKFHFDRDRNRYIARRTLLRQLVGRYLQQTPSEIEFVYNSLGKPELARPFDHGGLQFNLSKSGELAAYAFSLHRRVGIDIETIRPEVNWMEIAERFFHPQEISSLRESPEPNRQQLFFSYWTMKEAYLKARGVGLQQPLLEADFTAVVRQGQCAFTDAGGSRWLCASYRAGGNIIGALVVEG